MTTSYKQTVSQTQSQEIENLVAEFNRLDVDAKLAWLYLVYEKMGDTVTPAAPSAAQPELAPKLVGDYLQLSHESQLEIMRDIIECKDTEYSRAYGALTENNQLMVWYIWAEAMGDTVVGIPDNYKSTEAINTLVTKFEEIDFPAQMSVFRAISAEMGYSDVKPIPTQAETGKTSSF